MGRTLGRRNGERIKTTCIQCGKEVETSSNARKYCGRACYYIGERVDRIGICKQCGVQFEQRRASGRPTIRTFCNRSCSARHTGLNRTHPEWTEERRKHHMESMPRGDKHVFWRGGITPWQKKERQKPEYVTWRRAVFNRDDYTCQLCHQRGGTLQADHIKSWIAYPELRTELSNGRTLCVECHKKTPTYARNLKYQVIE